MTDLYIATVSIDDSPPVAIGGPPAIGGQDARHRLAVVVANLPAMLDSPDATAAAHHLLCGWLALGRWLQRDMPVRYLGPWATLKTVRPGAVLCDAVQIDTKSASAVMLCGSDTYAATRPQCEATWLFAAQCSRTPDDILQHANKAKS